MGVEAQKSALPTLFHFARVRAAFQPSENLQCQGILIDGFPKEMNTITLAL